MKTILLAIILVTASLKFGIAADMREQTPQGGEVRPLPGASFAKTNTLRRVGHQLCGGWSTSSAGACTCAADSCMDIATIIGISDRVFQCEDRDWLTRATWE